MPAAKLLDLFNSQASPAEIIINIGRFLAAHTNKFDDNATRNQRNLLFFYTGHGGFTSRGDEYLLTIRATRDTNRGATSIRVGDLAEELNASARNLNKILILDCCFAGSAFREFQSTALTMAARRTREVMPPKQIGSVCGTALLCSSSAHDVSRAPQGEKYTMFSGALLHVLRTGILSSPSMLSLEDVGEETRSVLIRKYADDAIRPEVHVPQQRGNNVAKLPLFPNLSARLGEQIRHQATLTFQGSSGPSVRKTELFFPLPQFNARDTQKGRWLGRSERDGRRLSAFVRIKKRI